MNAIAWAMCAYWWRAALGQNLVAESPVSPSADSRSACKSMACEARAVVAGRGPGRAATPADQCTSCLRFGHIAANCPDQAWRFK